MLGKGWFPDAVGGLDRYFRELLEHQREARGVVVGPAGGAPDRVVAASRHDAALPRRLLAFARAARRAGGDATVVDAHFALYALVPLLLTRLRRLPLVVHFQGPWADENVAQGDRSSLRRSLRRGLERAVYRRADRVFVLSTAFKRVLVERYGVSPWRVRVVPPGVDLSRFSPGDMGAAREALGLEPDAFVAVCVRRLVPRMGIDLLLDAWAQAGAELPANARLLIAGDGPQRGALEGRIVGLGLRDGVRLLGRIDDEALVDLYRAADVGVVPTRSFEGFGLVVIEAAACGTPTIVTRVGGLPEAVAGLDESLAVPPHDAPALAERIVLGSQEQGLPSRAQTRKFAEAFSWQRVVERNRAVQREALSDGGEVPRRLRVVYLDHVAQLSGGEIALLRLLPHLHEVDPHVIVAEEGPFVDALVQAGISNEVMPLAERARGLRKDKVTPRSVPLGSIAATAAYIVRLAIRLRRLRPDLLHTNSLKAGIYGSIAARLAGVPVVWHVRDRIASDYLPAPAVGLVRLMTRRLAAAVVANSHATMQTLDPHMEPVIIYSVVPEALAVPAGGSTWTQGPFTVGIVGRIAPWKGQDLFLRAFAEAFGDGDERCALVGSAMFGEDDHERHLHELADELGLNGRVDFRGFRFDVWHELSRIDLLVHASITPEPFGQVVLEGMAARVPVVAADAGGPAEIIEHDVSGVLYPIGDQAALTQAMRELAADAKRRASLVDGGARVVAAYHPAVIATQMQKLYRDVLRNRDGVA